MKTIKIFFAASMIFLSISAIAAAGDFDWMKEMSVQAIADPSGFRARLAARFKIGDATISTVLSNMPEPADAYMALRLGEMSRQPVEKVMTEYNKNKGKGWGVMAKNLGIKPGSAEFNALKKNHDLDGKPDKGKMDTQDASKDKGGKSGDKEKGKGKK